MSVAEPYTERVLDSAIITDAEGRVIANGPQQDLVFIRRKYGDGTVEVWQYQYGKDPITATLLLPRYDPETAAPKCRHCGEKL